MTFGIGRRHFITLLGSATFARTFRARAQQIVGRNVRIGLLQPPLDNPIVARGYLAFLDELIKSGFIEGSRPKVANCGRDFEVSVCSSDRAGRGSRCRKVRVSNTLAVDCNQNSAIFEGLIDGRDANVLNRGCGTNDAAGSAASGGLVAMSLSKSRAFSQCNGVEGTWRDRGSFDGALCKN